jgi:hypothetical protein
MRHDTVILVDRYRRLHGAYCLYHNLMMEVQDSFYNLATIYQISVYHIHISIYRAVGTSNLVHEKNVDSNEL